MNHVYKEHCPSVRRSQVLYILCTFGGASDMSDNVFCIYPYQYGVHSACVSMQGGDGFGRGMA